MDENKDIYIEKLSKKDPMHMTFHELLFYAIPQT
jgi:hypothetical protein